MNVPNNCSKNSLNSARSFIWIWVLTFLTVVIFVVASAIFVEKTTNIPKQNFSSSRLKQIRNNGVVVIGTSLTAYGFPYDDAMNEFAEKVGLRIQFVRFSLFDGRPEQFVPLLNDILNAKPKWVFLQVGPFISLHIFSVRDILFDIHQFLNFLIYRQYPEIELKNASEETDQKCGMSINHVATRVDDKGDTYFHRDPSLPLAYVNFLEKAKEQGTQIVLLQITRSVAYRKKQGESSVQKEAESMSALSKKYHLPLWISPALPLEYYVDGGHLNAQGRILFTQWFLEKLKNVSVGSK